MAQHGHGPLSRSLSDSELVAGCKHSCAGRTPFVEEQSVTSGPAGTRVWLLLSHPPSHALAVAFCYDGRETAAEELVVKEKLVMARVPRLPSISSSETEVTISLSLPDHNVSIPFLYQQLQQNGSNEAKPAPSPPLSCVPLSEFASTGDSLSLLLPFTAHIHNADDDGNNVLHLAARNSQNYALKLLLSALQREPEAQRRETVNARNCRGQTALHCAVRAEDADSVHYLLSSGAQLSLLDTHSNSVLHYLGDSHNEAIYKEILERPLAKEHLEAVNDEGFTPLHIAVRRLKLSLIEMLVDVSADVNGIDGRGRTALMHAIEMNDPDIVAFLLSKGADPNVEDNEGENPLLLSQKVANLVILGHLLDGGAQAGKETKTGVCLADSTDDQIQRIIAGERMPQIFKDDGGSGLIKHRPALFGQSSIGGDRSEGAGDDENEEGEGEEEEGEGGEEMEELEDGPSTSTAPRARGRHDAFCKDDISCLDYLTRLRLSKILDETSKWELLAKELECEHMVELIAICSFDSSPTMILLDQFEQLPDAKISRVRAALERLNEQQAVDLIEQRFVY